MGRIAIFIYGVVSYAIFFGTFLYAIAFVGNLFGVKSIDGEVAVGFWQALAVNGALLGVFAVQHSVMARPAFKKWLTRFVPEPAERATYVLASSLALIVLFIFWQPMGGVVWDVQNEIGRYVLYGLYFAGWLTVLVTTFLINHFDLFGLRQVWLHLRGQEYTSLGFMTPGPYKYVRHPLYVGWFMAFWFTPTMTVAHLVFAIGTAVYILLAIQIEEKDLVHFLGDDYADYKKNVPMIVPSVKAYAPDQPQAVEQTT